MYLATVKFLIIASLPESILKFRRMLIIALQDRGFDVHVASPGLISESADYKELLSLGVVPHSIRLSRRGLNLFIDIRALVDLLTLLNHLRPDYVLSYTIKPVIYGTLCAWLVGVRHRISMITGLGVVFTKGSNETINRLTRGLIKRLYSMAFKLSSKIIFQNNDDRKLVVKLGILKDQQCTSVVNGSGVDLCEFTESKVTKRHNFLIISRLIASKGIREYINAARIIKESDPSVIFTVVGWLDEGKDSIGDNELRGWIEEGLINYLGVLKDVRPAIMECSVYVLPSYREGTPRSVLEAMAIGRPIITTDAPGCRETVDGSNGFLVPVGDVESLVSAMRRFLDDPALIDVMSLRSLEIVRQKYDVNIVNKDLLNCMDIL